MLARIKYRSSIFAFISAASLVFGPYLSVPSYAQRSLQNTDQPSQALPHEAEFPRSFDLASGNALLFTPQIASWDDQKRAVVWAAVSYKSTAAAQPAMGVIKAEAETKVALEERLVDLSPVKITEINFPTLSRDESQKLSSELQDAFVKGNRTVSLDRLLAAVDKSQINPRGTDSNGLKADPPKIYYSATPAIIVNIDSQPIFSPIKDTDLKYAVNTNWDLFEHIPTKTFYLRNNTAWLKATDVMGPWSMAASLPPSFSKIPNDENWKEVKAALAVKVSGSSTIPKVIVSIEPAEMIVTNGQPVYAPVQGATNLLWVSNTESDLFRAGRNGPFYYLVAGRWFSAPGLDGPWKFATPELPADFKKIPVEHPRSRVFASVPGTDQAAEAVLLASVPQTAAGK